MNQKRYIILAWLGLFVCAGVIGSVSLASAEDDPEARVVMERMDARDDGDNRTAEMEMTLLDASGGKRVRRISTFTKDKGNDTLQLMFFLHPADVADTAFLTVDYDDPGKDDDQWLYLPALRKTKRIAAGDKSGSFMGSDLNYSDMSRRELDDYEYHFYEKGREQTFDGVKTWAVWAVPRSKEVVERTGYEKELAFVRQDNYVIVRSIHWIEKSSDLKYMMVNRLEKIDGIWTATDIQVTRKAGRQTLHKTILRLSRVQFNQKLDETLFTVRRMEKGM